MSYYANISGQLVSTVNLGVPLYGIPVADVELASTFTLPQSGLTLTMGNLSLAMSVYRQTTYAGRTKARLVGGAGGWNRNVQARAYSSAGGLTLGLILRDVAAEVGETIGTLIDGSVGTAFVRFADKASRVLRSMAGPEWWVSSTGATNIGPRTGSPITSPFIIEDFDGVTGLGVISSEDPKSWTPGNTYQNQILTTTQTLSSTRFRIGNDGKLRILAVSQ